MTHQGVKSHQPRSENEEMTLFGGREVNQEFGEAGCESGEGE